jgi:hypothetical protein
MRALRTAGLPARVRAHDQERVGLLDAGDGRIENVGGATGFGVEGIAALDREVDGAVLPQQLLQREHLLTAARSPAIAPIRLPSLRAIFAAIASNASNHDAGESWPFSLM